MRADVTAIYSILFLNKQCKSIYHLGASWGVLAGGKGVSSLSVEGVGISAIKSTYQSQLKLTRPDADAGTVG